MVTTRSKKTITKTALPSQSLLASPATVSSSSSCSKGTSQSLIADEISASSSESTMHVSTRGRTCSNRHRLHPRPKVLCLGMSYPSVVDQLKRYGLDPATWLEDPSHVSVMEAVKCVAQGLLTEMDARDLARCIATETTANVDVYTVSQENAAHYDDNRHVWANFNRQTFATLLTRAFGESKEEHNDDDANHSTAERTENMYGKSHSKRKGGSIQFRQVILDYFWIPQGWDVSHWSPTFFTQTLVHLIKNGLIDMDDAHGGIPFGVYIPFCLHCFRQIINALPLLSEYYAISFLKKEDLNEISLWKGTRSIDPFIMQSCLGKKMVQEDIYCTFGPQEVKEAMSGPKDVPIDDLVAILSQLDDFHDIRMVKLRPLKQHNPKQKVSVRNFEEGGLKGLVDPNKVNRGFGDLPVNKVEADFSKQDSCSRAHPKVTPGSKTSMLIKRRHRSTSSRRKKRHVAQKSPPKAKRKLFSSKADAAHATTGRTSSRNAATKSKRSILPLYTAVAPSRVSKRHSTSPYATEKRTNGAQFVPSTDSESELSHGLTNCRRRLRMKGSLNTTESEQSKQPQPYPGTRPLHCSMARQRNSLVDQVEIVSESTNGVCRRQTLSTSLVPPTSAPQRKMQEMIPSNEVLCRADVTNELETDTDFEASMRRSRLSRVSPSPSPSPC